MNLRRSRKRGVFLVEVIAVIAASTIVLGMAAALMALLLRLEHDQRAAMTEATALDQLALDLRRDVRATRSVEFDDNGQQIGLNRLDGARVSYRIEGSNLHREESRDGSIVRRETYRPASTASITWSIDSTPESVVQKMLILEVRSPSRRRDRPRSTRIEAAIGLDSRHAGSEGVEP